MNPELIRLSEVTQKENIVYLHIKMETRKVVLMKLFAGQQWNTDIENRLVEREGR